MKRIFHSVLLIIVMCSVVHAQDLASQTADFRKKHIREFITSTNSPLQKDDLKYLSFYEPDSSFRVPATFTRLRSSQSFEMPTYSGSKKTFVAYGKIKFKIGGKKQTLTVYRSLSLQTLQKYRNYLFLPFKDKTSGSTTYGGGRYIDLKISDVQDGQFQLDFNRSYNPYCAYSEGFNCPIPPKENTLTIAIEAGEKNFRKELEVTGR